MPLHVAKPGAVALRQKVEQLVTEREELRGKWRANTAALRDAVAAGRLFEVDIDLPTDIDGTIPEADAVPVQRSLFEPSGEMTIRRAVLEQLELAGEKGIKASRLRRIIENIVGRQLHYKTIGMTLYRLSKNGKARRDGYVWHYVP